MTLGAAMSAEMAEQPVRLACAARTGDAIASRLRGGAARATGGHRSDRAGVVGRCRDDGPLSPGTGDPPAGRLGIPASLYTMYGAQTDFTGFLVVAASQSGRTPEIV